jgi:outer membrane biosynthesis protein TonB
LEIPTIIDGGSLNEYLKTCDMPQFPADAKAGNLKSVETKLQVIIDEQGRVVQAKPISGHAAFGEIAAQAALKATFPKSIIAGKPVKVRGELVFSQTAANDVPCMNAAAK